MADPNPSPEPARRGRMEIFRAVLWETAKDAPCVAAALGASVAAAHVVAAGATVGGLLGLIGCTAAGLSAWTVNYFFRTQHFLDKVKSKWRAEDEARLGAEIETVSKALVAAGLKEDAADLAELARLRAELEQALGGAVYSFQRDDLARATREIVVSSLESLRHFMRLEEQSGRFPRSRLELERKDLEKKIANMKPLDPFFDATKKKLDLVQERIELARSLEAKKMEVQVTLDRSRHVLEKALVEYPDWSSPEGGKLQQCLDFFNEQVDMTRKVNEGLRGEFAPRQVVGS